MRFSSKNLSIFYTQLGTMINAGVPIQQALTTMGRTVPSSMKATVTLLNDMVQRGEPLHQALTYLPEKFTELDRHTLEISEQNGALDSGLSSLGDYHEKRARARSKIMAASMLPTLLFVGAVFISRAPQLILGSMGLTTYSLTDYLKDTFGSLIVLGLTVFCFYRLLCFLLKVSPLNLVLDRLLNAIPVFGRFRFDYALSQWIQSIRLMLKAGHGVIEALEFSSARTPSPLITYAHAKARPFINSQLDVSQALDTSGVLPPILLQFWSTGEQSGRMDEMLDKLTRYYEEQWQRNLDLLAAWLPRLIYGLVSLYIVIQILKAAAGYFTTITNLSN